MNITLPPLAFGNSSAQVINSASEMSNKLKSVNVGLKEYESISRSGVFSCKTAFAHVNSLPILAAACTPVQFKTECVNKKIIIPLVGDGHFKTDGKNLKLSAGESAVLLNDTQVSAALSTPSVLLLNYDEVKLAQTTSNMLGVCANDSVENNLKVDFSASRELKLNVGKISFDAVFRNYASVVNQFYGQQDLLNKSGVEDSIYSAIAMMMHPELFMDTQQIQVNNYDRRLLDNTCQYIQANLTQVITLSDLDLVSSMSRRKLHYAFQHYFACTPMQWVRTERLNLAQSKLMHAEPWQTVTSIALACGFTKVSSFAHSYRLRFGELPSTTLAKSFLS